MTHVPDKFRAILKQGENNDVDTKDFIRFCDMFIVYYRSLLPKLIDRYHSKIDLKSHEQFGIHCRDLYITYHNVPHIPKTQFREIQSQYDEYVGMVDTFNKNVDIVKAREYQNDVKIVENIIRKGNFGNKGYNTLKPVTDFNVFFQKKNHSLNVH